MKTVIEKYGAAGWLRRFAPRNDDREIRHCERSEATQHKGEQGFTLVELMVVIVIIGLLATIVVINVTPSLDKSAVTKAKADIATLEQGLEMYRLNNLRYPAGGQGLQALVAEGYVKRLPNDPWGNPYQYAMPGGSGRAFDVFSYGADGRQGGEDEDADIGTWGS